MSLFIQILTNASIVIVLALLGYFFIKSHQPGGEEDFDQALREVTSNQRKRKDSP